MDIVPQLSFDDGKVCSGCCKWHLFSEYHKNRSTRDGLQTYCKPCTSSKNKESVNRHLDEVRARRREENRRARIEQGERLKENSKRWYAKYGAQRARERRARNGDALRAYKREYWAKNKERLIAACLHRAALRRGSLDGQHTQEEWELLCARYGNRCLRCGSPDKLTRDHIVPLVEGGSDAIWNIQPLCNRCNPSKGKRHINFRSDRLLPAP